MNVVQKLEKRAREIDQKIKRDLSSYNYQLWAVDDRELLEQAAKRIKELESCQT